MKHTQDDTRPILHVQKEYDLGRSHNWAVEAMRLHGVKSGLISPREHIQRSKRVGRAMLPPNALNGNPHETRAGQDSRVARSRITIEHLGR